jgi:hypothetical protein
MGDVAKGAKIFKTKCAQCHVLGAVIFSFIFLISVKNKYLFCFNIGRGS